MTSYSSLKSHVKRNISSWADYICYSYMESKRIENEYSSTEAKKELADIVSYFFEFVYTGDRFWWFWSKDEFDDFIKAADRKTCEYCGINMQEMKEFYDIVQSDLFNKGQSFEIDRKVGRMKDYNTDKDKKYSFIRSVKECLDFVLSDDEYDGYYEKLFCEAVSELKTDPQKYEEEILYLPAPYNKDNCVLACHWCNNAKTDAFTADEFKPIGKEIGTTIQKILNEHKPKGNI